MQIVVLSDLHLGHKKIPGIHIYQNLKTYVYPKLKDADLVVLTGDTFHSLLDFNNEASGYVIQFLNDLFYLSRKYHFGVRILRGTFSHDRNQVEYIKQCAHKHQGDIAVDLKTYNDITLDEENIKGNSLKCLYLPDDLPYGSQEEVVSVIHKLLDERHWNKVDIIFGHGYLQHVLPADARGPAVLYTIESLSSICEHLAVFGHVHTPSIKRYRHLTCFYVGSFERMNHGEEEKKGFYTIDTDTWKTTFIPNKNTILFLTFKSNSQDTSKIVEDFKQWIALSKLSEVNTNFIRVIHNDPTIRILLGKILRSEYSHLKCVYTSESDRSSRSIVLETKPITDNDSKLIIPTEENIVDLIEKAIKDKGLPALSKDRIQDIWNLNFDITDISTNVSV